MYEAHDVRSHTHNRVRMHTCMLTHLARIPTFQCTTQYYIPYTNNYALMRAGYVLHSREFLECGVVGKCCSNVLRSLRAYIVVLKTVRTCVCEKSDTVRRSRCAIPYIQASARPFTPIHTYMPTYQIQTRVHALHVSLPSFQCTTQ
jgi:hypothetical protein